ncbi:MAG: hypothetical protein ACLUE2_09930 [Bacteroides cellulosilyticus]
MRNLLTGIFLMLGMLLTTLPVMAQGIEAELDSVAKRDDVTSTEQRKHGGCERDRLQAHWRCLRVAYYHMGKNARHYPITYYCI